MILELNQRFGSDFEDLEGFWKDLIDFEAKIDLVGSSTPRNTPNDHQTPCGNLFGHPRPGEARKTIDSGRFRANSKFREVLRSEILNKAVYYCRGVALCRIWVLSVLEVSHCVAFGF